MIGNVKYRPFTKEEKIIEDKENEDLAKDLDDLLKGEMHNVQKKVKPNEDDDLLLDLEKLQHEEKAQIEEKRKVFTPREARDETDVAKQSQDKNESSKNEDTDNGIGWQAKAVIIGALVVAGAAILFKRAYSK